MGFDPSFKAILEHQSRLSKRAVERAVLTNLHRDARIPDVRAAHCSAYLNKDPDRILDGLHAYAYENIRKSRKDGFVHPDNDSNGLGLPGGLPGRRADCEYGRVLVFTNKGFYNALLSGREYLVSRKAAVPSDFSSLPTINAGGFDEYCKWIRTLVGNGKSPFSDDLNQVFKAYGGYIDAIEDAKEKGVYPYEPAWITPWEKALQYPGIDMQNVGSWCLALGVEHESPIVIGLLKYKVPPAYTIYRPTCLEAGNYPIHYPTHCGLGTSYAAESGHTMACGQTAGQPTLKEWIHLQCPLYLENLVALQTISAPFPDIEGNVLAWRQRHFEKLTAEYPKGILPQPDFVG